MKKDIQFPRVKGVYLAIVQREPQTPDWFAYLINENNFQLDNILVTSKGYSPTEQAGEKQKTSILRHHIEQLSPRSYTKVERIVPEVFHLCNEYWISYYVNEQIYDKKFIFMPESITEENMILIDRLQMQGVLHG